jgi:excisionase family DNA binding protein
MNDNIQCGTALDKRVYNVDEIADLLNISKGSAYELIKQGVFNTVRIGSAIRVSKKSFDEWLDSQSSNE